MLHQASVWWHDKPSHPCVVTPFSIFPSQTSQRKIPSGPEKYNIVQCWGVKVVLTKNVVCVCVLIHWCSMFHGAIMLDVCWYCVSMFWCLIVYGALLLDFCSFQWIWELHFITPFKVYMSVKWTGNWETTMMVVPPGVPRRKTVLQRQHEARRFHPRYSPLLAPSLSVWLPTTPISQSVWLHTTPFSLYVWVSTTPSSLCLGTHHA